MSGQANDSAFDGSCRRDRLSPAERTFVDPFSGFFYSTP